MLITLGEILTEFYEYRTGIVSAILKMKGTELLINPHDNDYSISPALTQIVVLVAVFLCINWTLTWLMHSVLNALDLKLMNFELVGVDIASTLQSSGFKPLYTVILHFTSTNFRKKIYNCETNGQEVWDFFLNCQQRLEFTTFKTPNFLVTVIFI